MANTMFTPLTSVTAVQGDSGRIDQMIGFIQQLQLQRQQAEDRQYQQLMRGRQMQAIQQEDATTEAYWEQLATIYDPANVQEYRAKNLTLPFAQSELQKGALMDFYNRFPEGGYLQADVMADAGKLGDEASRMLMPGAKDYVSENELVARLSGWLYQSNPKTLAEFQRVATDMGLDPTKHYQMWNIYAKAKGIEERATSGATAEPKGENVTSPEAHARWFTTSFKEYGIDASTLPMVTRQNAEDFNVSRQRVDAKIRDVQEAEQHIDMNFYKWNVKDIVPKGNGYEVSFVDGWKGLVEYDGDMVKSVTITMANGDTVKEKNNRTAEKYGNMLRNQSMRWWYLYKTRKRQVQETMVAERNRLNKQYGNDVTDLYQEK